MGDGDLSFDEVRGVTRTVFEDQTLKIFRSKELKADYGFEVDQTQ